MSVIDHSSPTYWYQGYSPDGVLLRLPRTASIEAIAFDLMKELAKDSRYSREGKMYGVLLVKTPFGEQKILKAFSGLLNGHHIWEGWVPPISGREQVALEEARTLTLLDTIKQELITLQSLPEPEQYKTLQLEYENRLRTLTLQHQQRKQQRHQERQMLLETMSSVNLATTLEQLDLQSQLDGLARKRLKQERDRVLQPLQQAIAQANTRIRELKQQRKILSRQLQSQMYTAYSLMNFLGQSVSLEQLMTGGFLPTGTGDCCAPKLLHYAATHHLQPLAMAEFWWGTSTKDKIQGEFYGACAERCQPLMGFLLSGLPKRELTLQNSSIELPILYEDEYLMAVDKPSGLLSVPGRYQNNQDSVVSRLRHRYSNLIAVHRLDLETSGILLLARQTQTHRLLSQQFQQRQIHKVYEALLDGLLSEAQGVIELPLWGDPENRPYQKVDWQKGKPCLTHYKVIAREKEYTRVEFYLLTGRTHQLRVHAADSEGLKLPILGDRFYGLTTSSRLHLHAREIKFKHPQTQQILHLSSLTPF